jgi:hypothetical protein
MNSSSFKCYENFNCLLPAAGFTKMVSEALMFPGDLKSAIAGVKNE